MNSILMICASLIFFPIANGQKVHYVTRIRNCSMESETDSLHVLEMKIYNDKNEHKVAATVNITKDIRIKSMETVMYRCSFEKSDCENFQRWRFTEGLKSIAYMKNQIWTPIYDHITPKLDIPHIKKNVYHTPDGSLDPYAVVMWYPEVVNYFWRTHILLGDHNNKKAIIMKIEFAIFTFVERNKKRDRGGTRVSSTTITIKTE